MERIFQISFGSETPNPKTKTKAKHHRKTQNQNKPQKAKVRSQKFIPNSDPKKNRPDMERIFQDSFGSETPHPNTKA